MSGGERVTTLVPVKRFYVAKRRLAPVLDGPSRSRLGRDLADHTLRTARDAGTDPVVLAADAEVEKWATDSGWHAIVDPPGADLDLAASAGTRQVDGRWILLHADLPLLGVGDLTPALEALGSGFQPIAASNDGGTSLIGGDGPMVFSYGPGSFHRHLATLRTPRVIFRLGLALDLDDASDLAAAARHERGSWLGLYPRRP